MLKIFGCPHATCSSTNPATANAAAAATAAHMGLDVDGGRAPTEALRVQAISLLSRLMWYDKRQFKGFLGVLVQTRDVHFIVAFLHG